jgi:hypothetical protein
VRETVAANTTQAGLSFFDVLEKSHKKTVPTKTREKTVLCIFFHLSKGLSFPSYVHFAILQTSPI